MYPRVARAWHAYVVCRGQQLLHLELPKNKKTVHKIVVWPSGFNLLPAAGGLDDQGVTTMFFFEAFFAEERAHAQRELSK